MLKEKHSSAVVYIVCYKSMSNIAATTISYLAINPPVAYSVPQKGGVSAAEYSALKVGFMKKYECKYNLG